MPLGSAADLVRIAAAERGLGVVWTQEGSEDLNANLVRFVAGEGVGIHVNDEVDVVFVGVSGMVVVNGEKLPKGDPERFRRVRIPYRPPAANPAFLGPMW